MQSQPQTTLPEVVNYMKHLERDLSLSTKDLDYPILNTKKDVAEHPTIGWGHKIPDNQLKQFRNARIDFLLAEKYFHEDLKTAEDAVNRLVNVPLTSYQFSALVSLCFNVGVTAFANSKLLKYINESAPRAKIEPEFLNWINISTPDKTKPADKDGKRPEKLIPTQGLIERRKYEANLFFKNPLPYKDESFQQQPAQNQIKSTIKPITKGTINLLSLIKKADRYYYLSRSRRG